MGETRLHRRHPRHEQVAAAAAEEKAARAALKGGSLPTHPDWTPDQQREFDARVERWHAASEALIRALDRLSLEE